MSKNAVYLNIGGCLTKVVVTNNTLFNEFVRACDYSRNTSFDLEPFITQINDSIVTNGCYKIIDEIEHTDLTIVRDNHKITCDTLDSDEEVCIEIDRYDNSCIGYINKSEAVKIIEHLQREFKLCK